MTTCILPGYCIRKVNLIVVGNVTDENVIQLVS